MTQQENVAKSVGYKVEYDGKVYTVKGTQNEGKYIALKEIKKVPKVELLIPYVFKKGLNWSYGLC